jgi:hypothetical protein
MGTGRPGHGLRWLRLDLAWAVLDMDWADHVLGLGLAGLDMGYASYGLVCA